MNFALNLNYVQIIINSCYSYYQIYLIFNNTKAKIILKNEAKFRGSEVINSN